MEIVDLLWYGRAHVLSNYLQGDRLHQSIG